MDGIAILLVLAAAGTDSAWHPVAANEMPTRHTVRFRSGDAGWTGDRYSEGRQYDQRGATIGVEPLRTAQNSPWSLDGATQSATNTGNSLRNSVDSTIQQANQQFTQGGKQLLDSAETATRDFGRELQNMTGLGGGTAPPSSAASSRSAPSSWPAPPPLASSSQSTTPATWSSIRPELAPPRLPTPTISDSPRLASNPGAISPTGPAFPPPPIKAAPQATTSAAQDWSSVWGGSSAPATAASDSDSVGLVPVPPRARTTTSTQPQSASDPDADRWAWPTASQITSNGPAASSANDRYDTPSTSAPTATTNDAADLWANFGSASNTTTPSVNTVPDRYAPQPQSPAPITSQSQPAAQPDRTSQATIGVAPQAVPGGQPGEEVPWKPLLATSLALAGSLGANLFLGWSYADARHRYRSLVAKTTHSFQKAAGLAA